VTLTNAQKIEALQAENQRLRQEARLAQAATRAQAYNARCVKQELLANSPITWRRRFPAMLFFPFKVNQVLTAYRLWNAKRRQLPASKIPGLNALRAIERRSLTSRLRAVGRGYKMLFQKYDPAKVDGHTWYDYFNWARIFDTPSAGNLASLAARALSVKTPPVFTLIIPTYHPNEDYFRQALESVRAQAYPNWKVIVVDDGSHSEVARRVTGEFAENDPRFSFFALETNGGISAATNAALAKVTTPWVSFFDHDDLLPPHGLATLVMYMDLHPEWRFIYTDEDKVDGHNRRFHPNFKPDFDPLLLLGQNYITHLVTMQTSLVKETGWLEPDTDGAQDWDYVLRATELCSRAQVGHVPHVLYHWRAIEGSTALTPSAKPYIGNAGLLTVNRAIERRGLLATAEATKYAGHFKVAYRLPDPAPLVDIVIPTKDGAYLAQCLASLATTRYPNYRVTVIDNNSTKKSTARILARYPDVTVVRDPRPFNFAQLHNSVVPTLQGDYVLLLNDDTEVLEPEWLTAMVALAEGSRAGVVGAKLLYPNDTIQHAGVILTPAGCEHVLLGHHRDTAHYRGQPLNDREFSAVTGACLLIRRAVYEEVGGMAEELAVSFNDIDLCLRVGAAGYAVAYTPYATLRHHESATRGVPQLGFTLRQAHEENDYMFRHWGNVFEHDPAYNVNLAAGEAAYEMSWPPRLSPWSFGW